MTISRGYRKHLEDRKRRTLIMNGTVVESALSRSLLRMVYMNTPEGIATLGDTIAAGWPALLDMGATYGTAFLDPVRPDVGAARRESGNLVTVSLIACLDEALTWMDQDRMHPVMLDYIQQGVFSLFQKVFFVRFPANALGRSLGNYCVNEEGEIQVMFFPREDALLTYLREAHHIHYFEVRSSNITGLPEEPFAPGAVDYACSIAAPVVAVSSVQALETQMVDQALYKQGFVSLMRRKRFGSFPIIQLPTRPADKSTTPPTVLITRAGNTTPETVSRLLKSCMPEIDVVYSEEKHGHARREYKSPYDDAEAIQHDLIRAASDTEALDWSQYRDAIASVSHV